MTFENEAAGYLSPGQELARVCASYGDRARIIVGGRESEAIVAGAILHAASSAADLPATGDWVAARRSVAAQPALIESIFPRRSKIARRAAGRRNEEQVLAANVDLALIVSGLDGDFNPRRLERYLAIVREGGVEPVMVLNKADLCVDPDRALEDARRIAHPARVIAISATSGFHCDAIAALLGDGVTGALLGSSGAGKSTLVNRLTGTDLRETAPVRASDGRGRHTTTARELIPLPSGGALIDTPGLREIQLWVVGESVSAVFEEITELAGACRYRDCSHTVEPGCAVRGAVDAGRLESFQKLHREADRIQGAITEKQRWRSVHKAAKQLHRIREKW